MRFRRLILILAVALGLTPGTFVRSTPQLSFEGRSVSAAPIPLTPQARAAMKGPLTIAGAWHLEADHHFFGGFSGLVARHDGTMLAGSDRGYSLTIPFNDDAPQSAPLSLRSLARERDDGFDIIDLEAIDWDAETDQLWVAYENGNIIERIDPYGTRSQIRPPAMKDWSYNSGAETLVRLKDRRTLVIAEGPKRIGDGIRYHQALLFPDGLLDPENTPIVFRFVSHRKYRPVDAALLPSGKVAILLREVELALPPLFKTAIMVADPALITAGGDWTGSLIGKMETGPVTDNYEGITWVNGKAETQEGALYVVSDDNFSTFQRTLILRLEWEDS